MLMEEVEEISAEEKEKIIKEKPKIIIKNAADLQRLKLEKLMKNPDKPVIIPERPQERKPPTIPDFVRNVMGSSAGAGSGEFHVYRHLRRKEYARQKYIQVKSQREELDAEYHRKLEGYTKKAEEITAKKRARRLKRKEQQKQAKLRKKENPESDKSGDEVEEDDNEVKEETNAEENPPKASD